MLRLAGPDRLAGKIVIDVTNPLAFSETRRPGPPEMFIAGGDPEAKATVTGIIRSFGWPRVTDVGGLAGARMLEPLATLLIRIAITEGSFACGWKLLRQ